MGFKALTVNTPVEEGAHILAEDDATLYKVIIGDDCVFPIGEKFTASIVSNNSIRIKDGMLSVGGHIGRIIKGDYEDMAIANGVSGQNRNDLIVARFISGGTGGADTYKLVVVQGTPGATAADPAIVEGDLYAGETQRDYPLWRVRLEGLSVAGLDKLYAVGKMLPDKVNVSDLESIVSNVLKAAYPVGSIYMSVSNVNPKSLFGGTWVAWGSGRVPVGINTGDENFDAVEKTGGASAINLAHSHNVNAHAHSVKAHSHSVGAHSHGLNGHTHGTANHTLTTTQMPKHRHGLQVGHQGTGTYEYVSESSSSFVGGENRAVHDTGGNGAHNHGNTGGPSTANTANSSAFNTGALAAFNTGTSSSATDSKLGSASVVQPYITCYMWKRTA